MIAHVITGASPSSVQAQSAGVVQCVSIHFSPIGGALGAPPCSVWQGAGRRAIVAQIPSAVLPGHMSFSYPGAAVCGVAERQLCIR